MTCGSACGCGCCEGVESITPEPISNRPGLSSLQYRVGIYGSFLESMQARLSQVEVAVDGSGTATRPLTALRTRDTSDPSIAMLAGWATVADILTFYQERIANEGYLRTATERRSVLELGRLVDYTLRPGVASTVYLAYTIDENQAEIADIPLYSLSQSVPGPGEQPQSFETVEPLSAHAAWNRLQPRLTRPQTLRSIAARGTLYLAGVATNLQPGNALLLDDGTELVLCRVIAVDVDAPANRTVVTLAGWNYSAQPAAPAVDTARLTQEYAAAVHQAIENALASLGTTSSAAATAAASILRWLNTRVSGADLSSLDTDIREALAELAKIRASLPASATVVGPWLDSTIGALTAVRDRATEERAASTAEEFAVLLGGVESSGYTGGPETEQDDLLTVMPGLTRPPSVPPANPQSLRRDLTTAFQSRSDLGLQVVTSMRPELASLLPTALANLQAVQGKQVQAYALRVQAGVYGSTAPRRAVTDDHGQVITTVDWPIDGFRRITVRVVAIDRQFGTVGIAVQSRTSDGVFAAVSFRLSSGGNVSQSSGDLQVTAELSGGGHGQPRLVLTFKVTGFEQRLTVNGNLISGITTLSSSASDGSKFENVPVSDERVAFTSGGRLSEIYTEADPAEEPVLVYITEVPTPPTPDNLISLDASYEQLTPGGYAVVVRAAQGRVIPSRIEQARTTPHNAYNTPAKVTDLLLTDPWLTPSDLYLADIADTQVLTGSEALPLAEEPVTEPICGADQWIELDGLYSDLKAGRWLIVSGSRADIADATGAPVPGLHGAELVMLADVQHDVYRGQTVPPSARSAAQVDPIPGDTNHTFIRLAARLSFCYGRNDVIIYGNVVKATHGESRIETLGAGDGAQAFQSFTLKQTPLTFVPAPTAAGARSTLHVYVNDVEWPEVAGITDLGPADRGFITRTADDDKVTVIAGDGKTGARLPTGQENVRARYRQGLGKGGNVRAGQITLLQSRPLGVREVINPLRASGGAARENADAARKNVPLAVMALDRLVSLQDYADFARTFAGIGKAASTRLPFGNREIVHVTIAGADDIPIDPTSDLYRNLLRALHDLGDPGVSVRLDLRELQLIVLQAQIAIQPDRIWSVVEEAVRQSLAGALSFDNRDLGQDLWLSQVIGAMQSVPGVTYVNVTAFGAIPEKKTDTGGTRRLLTPQEIDQTVKDIVTAQAAGPAQYLPVGLATVENGTVRPAQIAVLSPAVPDTLILNQAVL